MTSCDSFHLFSSLPPELRLRIWTFNLPSPRLVCLHYTSVASDHTNPSTPKSLQGCTSSTPMPINLQVSRESRAHALKHYRLSFPLPHCQPKVWFDMQDDVLYFPAKEGRLGSWNHFVNALTMTVPVELAKVRRLAVHEALFRRGNGASSSPNAMATYVREFWEYVRKKFRGVEEVVVLVDGRDGGKHGEDVMTWSEDDLGCVSGGKSIVEMESPVERLVEGLGAGLRVVEEKNGWKAPRWDILRDAGETGTFDWLNESLAGDPCDVRSREKTAAVEETVFPRCTCWKSKPRDEKGFWIGGALPSWHDLA